MSAWAELVNADGSDEWLEKCSAALAKVQSVHAHRLAERQRAELDRMDSSPGYLADTEWAARAMKLPDLIDPEARS